MGILPQQIEAIVKIADQQGNVNNKVDIDNQREVSIFETEINKLGLSKKEKDEIFEDLGLLTSKDKKSYQSQVLDSVEKYVENGFNAQDMLQALRKEYALKDAKNQPIRNTDGTIQTNPQYTNILQEVENLVNSVPQYNSEEDVKKIDDIMTKHMNRNDKFAKDIVSQLQKQA